MSIYEDLKRLKTITKKCREDMHEPDEQGIEVVVSGWHLDNAMGHDPYDNRGEFTIRILNIHTQDYEWLNLANLIALARKADLD